jgi:hypothetical protein
MIGFKKNYLGPDKKGKNVVVAADVSAMPDFISDERRPFSKLVLPPLLRLLLLLLLPLPAPLLLLLFSFGISNWRLSGAGQLTRACLSTSI